MDDIAGASTAKRTIDYRASVRRVGLGMDAYEALQAIQRLARIALASEQGQSAEVLLDIQRRALNGIALNAEKALAKAP
jgi:hypothetical protein